MSIFIAPRDPSGWQWLVQCWRRWRNRKRGGLPKGYRDMGMVDWDSTPQPVWPSSTIDWGTPVPRPILSWEATPELLQAHIVEVHVEGQKPKAYVSPTAYAQLTPEYLDLYDVHVTLDDPPPFD